MSLARTIALHIATIVAAAILLRLLLLWPLGLNDDEAYYWMWARMPSWSYFDNTPGAGWYLWPVVRLFGDHIVTLRIFSCLVGVAAGVALADLARSIGPALDSRQTLWLMWLGCFGGVVLVPSLVWTPDAALLLFMMLGIRQFDRALKSARTADWAGVGLMFALALLAKANAGVYIAMVGFWLLVDSESRSRLATPGPWLALAIIASALLPVLYWNANNDWAFFRFQGGHVFSPDSDDATSPVSSLNWGGPILLILAFPLLAGPAVITAFSGGATPPPATLRMLRFVALSTTGLFCLVSIYKDFPAHWALPGILMLFAAGLAPLVRRSPSWRLAQLVALLPLIAVLAAISHLPSVAVLAKNWRNGLVWDQVYSILRAEQQVLPQGTLLASLRYQDASQLAFRERDRWHTLPGGHAVPALNITGRSNHYAHVWPGQNYRGADMLVMSNRERDNLQAHFCRVDYLGSHNIDYRGVTIRTIYLYYGRGFAGRPDLGFDGIDAGYCADIGIAAQG